MTQLDLFAVKVPPTPTRPREEERFGTWDARCGLSLRNHYSSMISGDRLAAYERAFRAERRSLAAGLSCDQAVVTVCDDSPANVSSTIPR